MEIKKGKNIVDKQTGRIVGKGFVVQAQPLPKKFFIVYTGQHKVLELSGIGKITIGHEYEVSEKVANSVRQMPDWDIITR